MDKFTFDVESLLFDEIANKKIKRLILLNNEAVRSFQTGNHLIINDKDGKGSLKIKITNLFYFNSIIDSLLFLDKRTLGFAGGKSLVQIEDYLLKKYPAEDVLKYGIAVIEFDII